MLDNDCKNSIYGQFCKPQFQTLFKKNDEMAKKQDEMLAELQDFKDKIYIDNGNRSIMTRLKDSEYLITENIKAFMKHIEEHKELKRNWSSVFYSLVKNAIWTLIIAGVTYLIVKTK